jgi:hypothetical protein
LPKSTTNIKYLQLRTLQRVLGNSFTLQTRDYTLVQIRYLEENPFPLGGERRGEGGNSITKVKALVLFPPDVLD